VLGESSHWLVRFSQIGLLGGFGEAKRITLGDNGQWVGEHCGHALIIEGRPGQIFEMRTMDYPSVASLITTAGMELAKLCQHHEPHFQYLSHVAGLLAEGSGTLKLAKIIDKNTEDLQLSESETHIIKPFVKPEEGDQNQQEPNNAK